MSGEGGGYGGYADDGGGYGGYGGGGYGGGGGVHVNPYAYGAEDYGDVGSNATSSARSRGASNISAGGTRSRGRSKQKYSQNDDAASDIDENEVNNDNYGGSHRADDIPNSYTHNKALTSTNVLESTREIYKADEEARANGKAPNQGLGCLCLILGIIFSFSVAVLFCYGANMIVIVGVFGDVSTSLWNYGWDSGSIDIGPDDNYVDTYTSRIASDAGDLVLIGCLMTIIFVIIGLILICVRYSSNLPLYSEICCIKIPHRAAIYTILNTIELFTRRVTIVYLILGIYGLIEMTYYVSYNCVSGECYAFIYPHYGWGLLLISTLIISICGFNEARKLDVKLEIENLRYYWPEHSDFAVSRNCKIDLKHLLKSLSNQRKILLNAIILYCLQQSGFLTQGVITSYYDDTNDLQIDVALLQPNGWNLSEYLDTSNITDYDNNTKAKNWVNWAKSFSDIFTISMCLSLINMVYLWLVLVRYSSFSILKWIYIVFNILLCLAWLGVTIMYYFSYYDYYVNGTGKSDVNLGPEEADTYTRFWFPGWAIFILFLNMWYLGQCSYYGYNGL